MPKNSRALAAMLLPLVVGGCVGSQPPPSPALDHPANADAPEVAPAQVSNTLAIQPATEPASHPAQTPMEGGHHHAH